MKKMLAYILVLVFILALVGCNDTQNNQNETSQNTTSQTATDTTTPDDKPEETSTEENFSNEDQPSNQPKELLAIVDLTETQDIPTDDALEFFYTDKYYHYIFSSIKSEYVIVLYKDGGQENVKVALEEGHISIEELNRFNISYIRKMKETLPKLTMSALKELVVTYGEDLTWSHFDPYYATETGSGLYMRVYEIDTNYNLIIGGANISIAPSYIYLSEKDNPADPIDVRYESIDEYVNEDGNTSGETSPEEDQPPIVYPVSVTYHSLVKDFILGYISDLTAENIQLETIACFTYSELEARINTVNSTRPYLPGVGAMSGYNINENNVIKVLESLYSIEYIACHRVGLTAQAMAEFGLDKDVYYLSYATFTGKYNENGERLYAHNELFISQKTERGTYYVASAPYDMIVEVEQHHLAFLEWDDMKWYNEAFIFHNLAYMRDLKFEFNGPAFGLPENKVYDFTLDNSLSYAYYLNEKSELKVVDFTNVGVSSNGKRVYEFQGKIYDIVAEVDLDTVEVVNNKQVLLDPTITNVAYVKENYYFYAQDGRSINVYPDYVTKTIVYENGNYYYVDLSSNIKIGVYRGLDEPVYRFTYKGSIYEAPLNVSASALVVSCNETIIGTNDFRELYMQLLYFSLAGIVDPLEFEHNMGMSVEEFLASDQKKPMTTITAHVEDYARALNGYTTYDKNGDEIKYYDKNNSQYLVYKFYQYSDWKVLVTIESFTKNEAGNLVPNSSKGVVGKFYVDSSILYDLADNVERLLDAEVIHR